MPDMMDHGMPDMMNHGMPDMMNHGMPDMMNHGMPDNAIPKMNRPIPKLEDLEEEFDDPTILHGKQNKTESEKPTTPAVEETDKGMEIPEYLPEWVKTMLLNFTLYELIMMVFFGVYILTFVIGKLRNDMIISGWYKASINYFKENYAHLGKSRDYAVNDTNLMMYLFN